MSTGLVSNIITQFCVTVIISTLFSLLASFTIIPWLSSRFGKLEHIEGKMLLEELFLGSKNINSFYQLDYQFIKMVFRSL
jgi:HAE1 family hydrophobic/amphiphilic exporter-1